jgi:hypothetical protein
MSWNNIVSLGDDDFRRYPRRYWGSKDRARAAREDRIRAELKALTHTPAREFEPLPIQSPNPMGAFSLNPRPSRLGQGARSRNVDQLLEHLGIRGKRRR